MNAVADIKPDNSTTKEDTPVTLDVLKNDGFGPGAVITAVNGSPITEGASVTVSNGSVMLVNNKLVFTPDPDFNATVPAFTYTVTTTAGDLETANINLTVNAVADIKPDTSTTDEDTPVIIDVLKNDGFAPGAVITAVNGSPIAEGTSVTVPNGNLELVNGKLVFTPALDFNGVVPGFTYSVTTAAGDIETSTIHISVKPVIDPIPDVVTSEIDKPINVDILANDPKVDPGTIHIVGTDKPGDPLVVPGEGTWTINPNTGILTFTPLPTFHAAPSPIKYTVTDANGVVSSAAIVKINIQPVVTDDTVIGAKPDVPVIVDVLANDKGADPTTVKIEGATNTDGSLVVVGEGAWTVDKITGQITFTPLSTFHGDPAPIRYTVQSTSGLPSKPATVTIHVQLVAPVVANDTVTANPDVPVTIAVLGNDKNVDPTTVKIVGATNTNGSLVVAGEGTWTVGNTTGQITFTPVATFHGTPTPIQYTVRSPAGVISAPANVTIKVLPVPTEIGSLIILTNPEPPLFTTIPRPLPFASLPSIPIKPLWENDWFKPVPLAMVDEVGQCDLYLTAMLKNQLVIEREAYHFAIPAGTFRHTNPSEQLEYTATKEDGTPLPRWLKFDDKTLTFSGVPPKGAVSEMVMVTVRDACGDEVHATFFVKVNKEHRGHSNHDNQHSLNKGKLGLNKQLHAAGKMGRLQNGRELLDNLSAEQDGENVTILKSQKG